MKYNELLTDFDNIRETQNYVVGKVIDEAQNYIEYLEMREDILNNVLEYLDKLDNSDKTETKQEILDEIVKIVFPSN